MKPIVSLQKPIKKYASQERAHIRYRSKRSIDYQQWSVWSVGLDYSALVLESAREELLNSWKIRFPELDDVKPLTKELFFCSVHSGCTTL